MKFSWPILPLLLSGALAVCLAAQSQSPTPVLPSDIPKDAAIWIFLTDKSPSGQDAVWTTPDGAIHEFFQYNDRGRGPKTYSTYRPDGRGIVASEETHGVDYMKNPVIENFSLANGEAAWKNQSEDGHQGDASGKYFVDLDGGPASGWLLAQALLKTAASWHCSPEAKPACAS